MGYILNQKRRINIEIKRWIRSAKRGESNESKVKQSENQNLATDLALRFRRGVGWGGRWYRGRRFRATRHDRVREEERDHARCDGDANVDVDSARAVTKSFMKPMLSPMVSGEIP